MFCKTKKAFTIVELVIVLAVIAILMGIMFVGGTAISNNAKQSTLESDYRTFETNLKAMVNAPENAGLSKGKSDTDIRTMINGYFEDEMAIGTFAKDESKGSGVSVACYEAKTAMKDPYGIEYNVVFLDNSSAEHTDLSFAVYSCGKNKQTGSTQYCWDEDDTAIIIRVWDSMIYTKTIGPKLENNIPYQQAVNDGFVSVGIDAAAGAEGSFSSAEE